MAIIVTVTSYKGGIGKTTTSIHLAEYLQRFAPTLSGWRQYSQRHQMEPTQLGPGLALSGLFPLLKWLNICVIMSMS